MKNILFLFGVCRNSWFIINAYISVTFLIQTKMEAIVNQRLQKVKFAALTKKEMAKIGGGVCDMTPKERCEYNNVGRCGVCDTDGTFTACA
jgi:hypothetical protein